jgi:hypothetical protein
MDETYLMAMVRYVECNPVAARLCRQAQDWPWPSAAAHLRGRDDGLVEVQPMFSQVDDWAAYSSGPEDDAISAQSMAGRATAAMGSAVSTATLLTTKLVWISDARRRCVRPFTGS